MSHHAPLILDIAGTQLTAADRKRLKHPLTGGIILFGRNWANRQQLTQLCADIKAVRSDLLICVDHEGGRVQRFRNDGFTHIPPMRALGELWMTDQKGVTGEFKNGSGAMAAMDAATASGYVLASELRACGVDFSFTPVLDLDHGESGVIGDRSFHRDPRVATTLAKNVMHGLLLAGMANCGKHFPGHGFVKADSHVDIPVDKRSLKAILGDCALPYQWLTTTLTSVMPAHVIYPKVSTLG
jgi:beta-N-acetylhexosaminidase